MKEFNELQHERILTNIENWKNLKLSVDTETFETLERELRGIDYTLD